MSIKEKVIAGLRCCIVMERGDNRRCSECPYRDPTIDCTNQMHQDMLAVLEAEEEPECEACMIHFDDESGDQG